MPSLSPSSCFWAFRIWRNGYIWGRSTSEERADIRDFRTKDCIRSQANATHTDEITEQSRRLSRAPRRWRHVSPQWRSGSSTHYHILLYEVYRQVETTTLGALKRTGTRAQQQQYRACTWAFSCLERRKLESWVWLYMAGFPATGMYCARLRMRCRRLAASMTCFFTWSGRDAITCEARRGKPREQTRHPGHNTDSSKKDTTQASKVPGGVE